MKADPGSFMARLKPEDAADLRQRGRSRRWRKGCALFTQGDLSRWVAILLSGTVKVSSLTDSGNEIVLGIRRPGGLIGELEAADGKPRPATVVAIEPVEAVIISHEDFAAFLSSHRDAVWLLVGTLCERLRAADRKRVEIGSYNTTRRLAQQLVELAEDYGQPADHGVRISLPLTQDDLASWIGASREAVSKAFRSLRLRGWIETGRKTILVRDLAALRERAM
jgi:CRP/FNR family transcriptional regulator, cyclic AMP receptor protein